MKKKSTKVNLFRVDVNVETETGVVEIEMGKQGTSGFIEYASFKLDTKAAVTAFADNGEVEALPPSEA